MPRVPTYPAGGTVEQRPAFQSSIATRATPDDFGAAIGRGMGQVAAGARQAADSSLEIIDLEDRNSAHLAETQFSDWAREAAYGDGGYFNLQGQAAVEARKDFEKKVDEKRLEFGQALRPSAGKYYSLAADARVADLKQSVVLFASRENKVATVEASDARRQSFAADAVAGYADGVVVERSIASGVAEIRNLGKLAGWSADKLDLEIRNFTSSTRAQVLARQAMQDPVAAADWLFSNFETLNPDDGAAVMRSILPALKSAAASESALTETGVEISERIASVLEKAPDVLENEIRDGIVDELLGQRAQQASIVKVAYDAHRGATEKAIVLGEIASEDTIANDPQLNDADKAELIRSLRSQQATTGAARAYIDGLRSGTEATLNPYDSDDRKTASRAYEIMVAALPAATGRLPPDERDRINATRRLAAVEFVRRSQIIPDDLMNETRLALVSPDPSQVVHGLQMAARLYDAAPSAFTSQEGGRDLEVAAGMYREFTQRGQTVEDAARHVMALRDPEKRATADVLDASWKKAAKDLSVGDVRKEFRWGIFGDGPAVGVTPLQSATLEAEYLDATRTAYMGAANGDIGVAKSIALAEIKRTWGITRVSGQETLTKFPPEQLLPPIDGGHDYIRQLALKSAREIDPKASNIALEPTPSTAADVRAGRPPHYNLRYLDSDGVWQFAAGEFVIGGDELADLGELQSRERQVRFEIDRIQRRSFSDPAYGQITADRKALNDELAAIEAQRKTLLGAE